MPTIYNNVPHTTARLFLSQMLFRDHVHTLVITDDTSECTSIPTIHALLGGVHIQQIHTLADMIYFSIQQSGYGVVHIDTLRSIHTPAYIAKHCTIDIHRGLDIPINDMLEKFLALGYIHTEGYVEAGTYKKEGGILKIGHPLEPHTIYWIEYFDTEIDSIVQYIGDARTHVDRVIFPQIPHPDPLHIGREGVYGRNIQKGYTKDERVHTDSPHDKGGRGVKKGVYTISHDSPLTSTYIPLSKTWIEYIQHIPTVVYGCDFVEEKDMLPQYIQTLYMYPAFSSVYGVPTHISVPTIDSLVDLKMYIQEKGLHNIHFYTRYEKSLLDFLVENDIGVDTRDQELGIRVEQVHTDSPHDTGGRGVKKEIHITSIGKKSMESLEITSSQPSPKGEGVSLSAGEGQSEVILISDDILGRILVRTRGTQMTAKNLDLLLHIRPDDHIVHRDHGIGRYMGIISKTLSGVRREYLEIHYAQEGKLYVPITELHRVTKYVGSPDVELTKLEGKEWEKVLKKTDEEIEKIAQELLSTSAKRAMVDGYAFAAYPEKEDIFLKSFKYVHTDDQICAIQDIRADMEKPVPMDRLLAGDVGFGKTEVAMNAIYKAVLSGAQVACISPLLVLADEHAETFLERFGPYGIRVARLSRMSSVAEQKNIIKGLADGSVDVVVGTHRLLSEDIVFRRLGLLVIDEEHKFGVIHKEKFKQMKAHLDILSLSATPIPRSLNMALSGVKKISILATPPKLKKSIDTIVSRWNENTIYDAVHRELARGGQVLIIHNRIASMEHIEKEIRGIVESYKGGMKNEEGRVCTSTASLSRDLYTVSSGTPSLVSSQDLHTVSSRAGPEISGLQGDKKSHVSKKKGVHTNRVHTPFHVDREENIGDIRITTTHGRMSPEDIEDRIHDFKSQKYDILITTTIVENGVNFLTANTILILDPQDYGLAQLHQLRGRVGRRDIQGYCYLMYRKPELSPDEKERLVTLVNHSHLGAGFEIAMRDMEMRGAGDILGIRQAGKVKEVGVSLYFKMLEEKVEQIRTGKVYENNKTHIQLAISYAIDDIYFDSDIDKISFFRNVESLDTVQDIDTAEQSFLSLHTTLSIEAKNFFMVMRASIYLGAYRVTKVSEVGTSYVYEFAVGTTVDTLRAFLGRYDTRKNYVIVSGTRIRVDTRLYSGVEDFLCSIVG